MVFETIRFGRSRIPPGRDVTGSGRCASIAKNVGEQRRRTRPARTPAHDLGLVVQAGIGREVVGLPAAPAFGSAAPNTTSGERAAHTAPAHIGHGSSVTTSAWSSSRQVPRRRAAARSARSSACAVGSSVALACVVRAGDDLAGRRSHDDRADRHVVVLERELRFVRVLRPSTRRPPRPLSAAGCDDGCYGSAGGDGWCRSVLGEHRVDLLPRASGSPPCARSAAGLPDTITCLAAMTSWLHRGAEVAARVIAAGDLPRRSARFLDAPVGLFAPRSVTWYDALVVTLDRPQRALRPRGVAASGRPIRDSGATSPRSSPRGAG